MCAACTEVYWLTLVAYLAVMRSTEPEPEANVADWVEAIHAGTLRGRKTECMRLADELQQSGGRRVRHVLATTIHALQNYPTTMAPVATEHKTVAADWRPKNNCLPPARCCHRNSTSFWTPSPSRRLRQLQRALGLRSS